MEKRIHFNTIQKCFKKKFNVDIEQKEVINNKTGEVYNVVYKKGTDIAVFTEKGIDEFICIDSNGDKIEKGNIIGYVNGVNTTNDEHGLMFSEKDLVLHFDNKTVDVAQLIQREKELYPERTAIILQAELMKNNYQNGIAPFYVDEVIYVSNEEFEKIKRLEYSDVLKEYNERVYDGVAEGNHGVAIINELGDGLLIDTQGYDYARYMAYAPQVGMAIDNMLARECSQKAIYEMKLYVPLRVVELGERYDIDGGIYFDKIRDTVRRDDILNEKRGLAEYLSKKNICQKKVYSIKPDIERVNDVMMGVVAIKMTEPLSQGEIDDLKDYITGQFSDGWGESFEQQAIQVDGNQIYVHFWNSEEYFIKTEEEMMADQEQEFEMEGMQGIQGMSGMSGM